MQDEISSREFAEWQAYYRLEPFGQHVMDIRLAHLMAWIGNALGSKKKISARDVMLRWDEDEENDVPVADRVRAIFGLLAHRKK